MCRERSNTRGWGRARVARGLGAFAPTRGAPTAQVADNQSRPPRRSVILRNMCRFADSLALAAAGALSAAPAWTTPGDEPDGARG